MIQHYGTPISSLLSKFIDSIEIKLNDARCYDIVKPFQFSGTITGKDVIVQLSKGDYFLEPGHLQIEPQSFYFIPSGQTLNAKTGNTSNAVPEVIQSFSNEWTRNQFMKSVAASESLNDKENVISYVTFETVLYHAFPFFPLLIDLKPFVIPYSEEFAQLIKKILIEKEENRVGKELILKSYLNELAVFIFRFIDAKPELKKPIEKLQYLTDVRLIDIVKFVRDNLDKDLSNKAIAKVAYVSEDYVGQFFKALTKGSLQDYVESQRLERAMHLLKTIPNSVQEVAAMVGFKDAAYFSRRFRMHFHVNANLVRQGKVQDV